MALAGHRSTGRQDRSVQTRGLSSCAGRIYAAYRACLTAILILISGPALALSCLPWTYLNAWEEASTTDKLYLIIRGQLLFNANQLPEVDWDRQEETPQLTRIDAFLTGDQLGRNGFKRPYQSDVTLEIACYGPWCAGLTPGVDYILFVEMREGERVVATNPCGGFVFSADDQVARDLTRCMRGDACAETPD